MKPDVFVTELEGAGLSPLTGVPCSVFRPLLDYVADNNDPVRSYLCSSEGEAMGLAAGFALSGRIPVVYMQNDGYGNAVNPLSSLQLLYRLPALLLISWRGEPGVKDAPQHTVMGRSILSLLELFDIPTVALEGGIRSLNDAVAQAKAHCTTTSRPFAFIIRKGYFDTYSALATVQGVHLNTRLDYIHLLSRILKPDDVLLGATGFSGREMDQTIAHTGKLYMMGSMGCLASMGLAIALENPHKRVILLDGDGAILMKMGTLATVGRYRPANLVHICFDNGAYESTGGQPTLSHSVDLSAVATACGYPTVYDIKTTGAFELVLKDETGCLKPLFARVHVRQGTDDGLTRPSATPEEMRDRLMAFLR